MSINYNKVKEIINRTLDEDLGLGDITSEILIPKDKEISFTINNRESVIVCGAGIVRYVFEESARRLGYGDADFTIDVKCSDGDKLHASSAMVEGSGKARLILAAERTALNLMQHMSGISTMVGQFVKEVEKTNIKIVDTRKTLPCLLPVQKFAVKTGGGYNHRYCLGDGILIKDNHIAAIGSVKKAVETARLYRTSLMKIEVECEDLDQVKEAVKSKADTIMLDNMAIETMKEAVNIIEGSAEIEASGGINLKRVQEIVKAKLDVDYISVGSLTNSAPAVDIGLEFSYQ